jgi:spore maturation protein CgeB
MKVLAVLPPDRWMEINLLDTLRHDYCDQLEVFTYPGGMGQLGSSAWRAQRDQLNEQLVIRAKMLKTSGRLDLMFFIVYDDFLLVETAQQLRALGVPMINYHVDMAFQWYRVIRTAPYFDMLAVAQMTHAEHLARYNPNIHWMPMAANPRWYSDRPSSATGAGHDLSFVGSFNPFRRALIDDCVKQGFKPAVYGKGWNAAVPNPYRFDWDYYKVCHDLRYYGLPRVKAEGVRTLTRAIKRKYSRRRILQDLIGPEFHPPCADEALPLIFRSSRVNLGFSDTGWHGDTRVLPSNNLQCRLRDFEVPMSGGFYLVQRAPGHEDYYNIGEEIEVWTSSEELIDKLSYYSKHVSAAWRIREAGQKRALASHTWRHRFDAMFERLRARVTPA